MTEYKKHAYLILAHKDDFTFRTLIHMLDDNRNDIFIHMDMKLKDFDENAIKNSICFSNCFFTKRSNVVWGGYSQINAELLLLALATETGQYAYYHLLSGEELPIKTQNYIHDFFYKNDKKEFLRFESEVFNYNERVKYHHYLQEKIGRGGSSRVLGALNKLSLTIQKLSGVNRNTSIYFQKGDTWFSITDDLARYVISKRDWIKTVFSNTVCCDEVYLHTIVINSGFVKHLYHSRLDNDPCAIMRLIDWKRGSPYIFRKTDMEEIKKSDMLWARKFDCKVDLDIIEMIADKFLE